MLILIMLFVAVSYSFSDVDFQISENIKLIHLKDSLFIHETLFDYPGFGKFPSNGMLLIKNGKGLLVDTPADNSMTKELLTFVKDSLNATVTKAVLCHSHIDCMGGIETLHKENIETFALDKTFDFCKRDSLPVPHKSFKDSLNLTFEGEPVTALYLGAGHTLDNIVVSFSKRKTLFGGCLIKSAHSGSLGNVKEADISAWGETVGIVQKRFPNLEIVIPGHGTHGDKELLSHTIGLVEKHMSQSE